jgi:hypothetical protein
VAVPGARQSRAGTRVAQPVAVAASAPPPQAHADGIDVPAANDLITRARATAARKAEEKRARESERASNREPEPPAQPEAKPKIIQLQEWLAGQLLKKQNGDTRANNPYKPQSVRADADGVSDIVYAPLGGQAAIAYQETIDYERCVGWTD